MQVRRASAEEGDILCALYREVKGKLNAGSTWTEDYPADADILADIAASALFCLEEDGKSVVKLSGDEIRLEGDVTANGNVSIDDDGTMTAKKGVFEECLVSGFVSGGVYQGWDNETATWKSVYLRDRLRVMCQRNTQVYLPTDPEYIGARVTVIVAKEEKDSGSGETGAENRNLLAQIRAGRTYCRHTYSERGGTGEGISHRKDVDDRPGTVKTGLLGTQWFYSPVRVQGFMPNLIEMGEGVLELVGVASDAWACITRQRYRITEQGTLDYGNGSAPLEDEGEDKAFSGEAVQLTQWAIVNYVPLEGSLADAVR